MDIDFECQCGSQTSLLTRSSNGEINFHMQCDDCEAMYAVTITPLTGPEAKA